MAAENRDFGRFVTTWYSVHCKHTRFFEFLGLLNDFFLEEAWFWGVRVGFGGREGALASALIYIYIYMYGCLHQTLLVRGLASLSQKCAISDIAITSARNNIF